MKFLVERLVRLGPPRFQPKPKRDKSISARQWKKRVKQQRREAKVAA